MSFNPFETNNDMVDCFFDFGSDEKFEAAKPQLNVALKCDDNPIAIDHKRIGEAEYVDKYRLKEDRLLANQTLNAPTTSRTLLQNTEEDSDSDDTEIKTEIEDPEEAPDITQRYCFNLNPQELPILRKRDDILSMVEKNKVSIISSATGTGKSSQVPQYILEQAFGKNENCNIIVTQPRRIAGKNLKCFITFKTG